MSPLAAPVVAREDVVRFFDDFCRAFLAFDGAVVAERYAVPYMAIAADGTQRVLTSSGEIAVYFQGHLDRYREQGCQSCAYDDLTVFMLGTNSAVASLTWRLLGGGSEVVTSWRESCNLVRQGEAIVVCASTDHAG